MDFDLSSIRKYYLFKSNDNRVFQNIPDETAEDLNLDFLFFKLDHTKSKIGKQYFYSKLRIIPQNKDSFFDHYVDYCSENKTDIIEKELGKLNKFHDYEIIDLIENRIFINQKYLNYAKLSLTLLCIILVCGIFVKPVLGFIIPLFLVNAYFHYANKSYVEYYNAIISRLYTAVIVAKNISKTKALAEEYKTIDLKRLVRAIWSANAAQQLAKNEFLIVFWLLLEIVRITFNLEIFGFSRNVNILNASKDNLLKIYEYIGKIDTAVTLSEIKHQYTVCKPVFSEKKEIKVERIYHPLIDGCVKNDLHISDSGIVLTGSNMSGKTTFMRSLAVNALMAQLFGFCFADAYEAPFMKILTSISIKDDINENKSYYLEEVLRIKDFFNEKDGFNLILIDEIFKGTGTKERIAISKAVLKAMNSERNLICITTHDLEIANFLERNNYALYYFSEEIQEDKLQFTYQLNRGINQKPNAIRILKMYGYPEELIKESYTYLE